jgi:predicted AlkP superfamily pyrophosphatase or phosphodiesterase
MNICRKVFREVTISLLLWGFLLPYALAQNNHVVLVSVDGLAAYHLEDESLELPNIRELIRGGVWAASAETVFPSVTHPSHTTMTTGVSPRVHGVLGNTMRNRITGESFHISNKPRSESIRGRTVFDAAREKGLTTAAFIWPETWRDPSIDFNIPSRSPLEASHVDPKLLDQLREAGVLIDLYFEWTAHRFMRGARDIVLAQAAGEIIRRHRPHLTAVHFLVTDSIQHGFGPEHYLSKAALTKADYCIGLLVEAVREAGIEERTTFIIAADHGFHSVTEEVNLYPVLQRSGLKDRITLHAGGWSTFVELPEDFHLEREGPALEKFLDEALRLDGVAQVIRPEEFHHIGFPRYEEDPHVRGHYLIVAAIDNFLVSDPTNPSTARYLRAGPSHGHGYLPTHPRMFPGLVLSGYGIREGIRIGHVRNHDIASTIAELLRLELREVEGRVLEEALAP